MKHERPTQEYYDIFGIVPKSRPDVKNPALELILKDIEATKSGKYAMAYNNRYPDYHNCCTWWGD